MPPHRTGVISKVSGRLGTHRWMEDGTKNEGGSNESAIHDQQLLLNIDSEDENALTIQKYIKYLQKMLHPSLHTQLSITRCL